MDWVTCFENMVYLLQIFSKQLQHTFQLVHFRSQSGRGIFTAGNKKQKTLLAGPSMAGFVWHFFFLRRRLNLQNGFQCQITQCGDTTVHLKKKMAVLIKGNTSVNYSQSMASFV